MEEVLGVKGWQGRVGDDRLADDLGLELLFCFEFLGVLVHENPVGVDDVVDDLQSEG